MDYPSARGAPHSRIQAVDSPAHFLKIEALATTEMDADGVHVGSFVCACKFDDIDHDALPHMDFGLSACRTD